MHILFIHKNYPAQFGHVANFLSHNQGIQCSFLSEIPVGNSSRIQRQQYLPQGGTTESTHYCCRTFENQVRASHGLLETLKSSQLPQPDLIVSHSGFVSPLFLRNLYDCPTISYFEYYYQMTGSDMDFRPDFVMDDLKKMRAQARNAMLLLDLENCDAGYSPTCWQRDVFPEVYHPKIRQLFDGIDTNIWKPLPETPRHIPKVDLPPGTRVVTYVSRGLEAMRGFDVFMKVAKRICDLRDDVVFLVIGEDRTNYGDDLSVTGGLSFKNWVLSQDNYDLSRIHFLDRVPPLELAKILAFTDLHIYLTVPFVLSWSLMNAMSCGATVLASETPPVQEMIEHDCNGLLAPFFDVDTFVQLANRVLEDPSQYQHLGQEARKLIVEKYSTDHCLPAIYEFFQEIAQPGSVG